MQGSAGCIHDTAVKSNNGMLGSTNGVNSVLIFKMFQFTMLPFKKKKENFHKGKNENNL